MEVWILLRWALVFAALTAAGAPIAAYVFDALPRSGGALALPSALIPFAIAVFWIGQVTFGTHTVVLSALLVAGGGALAYWRGVRPNWRAVAGGYGVFLAAFLAFAVVRATRPGITPAGGEQFLHYGLVKALLAAETLPPEDFWFAGEVMRYYYGTQLQVAAFSVLTGTHPRFGFNLGIAAFYGILVVTAYGLGGAVVSAADRSYRLGGTLAVVFVALGGATTTAIRLLTPHLPDGLRGPVAEAAFGFMAQRFRGGDLAAAIASQGQISEWFWWYTRYVVPGTLQEFPLYSLVKADLHGHALANGYVLFVAALAFAYYRTPVEQRTRRLVVVFGGIGAVAGLFGFMNTWSLPTAAGVVLLAVAAADPHPATLLPARFADLRSRLAGDGRSADAGGDGDADLRSRLAAEASRYVLAVVVAALVVGIGVAIASPFLVFGSVPTNEGIGILPERSPIAPFLVIYGGVLGLLATYLGARCLPALRDDGPVAPAAGVAVVVLGVLIGWLASFPVLAVTLPLIVGGWWLVRTDRMAFEGVLLVAGVGLLLSMELVYAKVWPPTQQRWNTTLKVAVQAWTLMAAAAGTTGALALGRGREAVLAGLGDPGSSESSPSTATDGGRDGGGRPPLRGRLGSLAVAAVVVVVVVASLPFAGLIAHKNVHPDLTDDEPMSVDGMAVHETFNTQELEAIRWLDRRGSPTVVEAPGHQTYSWTNPASTLSSANAVIGWDHQRGYRGNAAFECRANRSDAVYTGPEADMAAVLRTYEVDYVYVGSNERDAYGDLMRDFEAPAFETAFENDAATIYAVNYSALPERERLRPCPRAG